MYASFSQLLLCTCVTLWCPVAKCSKEHIKETLKSLYLPGAIPHRPFARVSYRHEAYSTVSGAYCRNTVSLGGADQRRVSGPALRLRAKPYCSCTLIITAISQLKIEAHLSSLDVRRSCGIKARLTLNAFYAEAECFSFSLKSTQTSPRTHIISEQNHNRVWNYPEAGSVCVLGLSRHLRALVHCEWPHAGPVPSLRITRIRIRFAEDIRHNEGNSWHKCFFSSLLCGCVSEGGRDRYRGKRDTKQHTAIHPSNQSMMCIIRHIKEKRVTSPIISTSVTTRLMGYACGCAIDFLISPVW